MEEIIGDGLFETFRFPTGISVDFFRVRSNAASLNFFTRKTFSTLLILAVCNTFVTYGPQCFPMLGTKGTTFSFKYIIFKLGNV